MTTLSWNCLGLGNTGFIGALKDIINRFQPNMVFLIEALMHRAKMESINKVLGLDNSLLWTL